MNKILSFLGQIWIKLVIAIVVALVFAGLKFIFKITNEQILEGIQYPIPVYWVLIGIAVVVFLIFFIRSKVNSIWRKKLGIYSFKELYLVLSRQKFPVRTEGMIWKGKEAPNDDFLSLYYFYKPYLNMGVTMNLDIGDDGYLYGVFCPKIVSYGLVEKTVDSRLEKGLEAIESYRYEVTQMGHDFYNLLEKVRYLKKKKPAKRKDAAK